MKVYFFKNSFCPKLKRSVLNTIDFYTRGTNSALTKQTFPNRFKKFFVNFQTFEFLNRIVPSIGDQLVAKNYSWFYRNRNFLSYRFKFEIFLFIVFAFFYCCSKTAVSDLKITFSFIYSFILNKTINKYNNWRYLCDIVCSYKQFNSDMRSD